MVGAGDYQKGMKDFELYQQILGLTEPWRVAQVTLKITAREVEVRIGYAATLWGCPECQQRMVQQSSACRHFVQSLTPAAWAKGRHGPARTAT